MNTFQFIYPVMQLENKKFKLAFNLIVTCKITYSGTSKHIDATPEVISVKLQHGHDELIGVLGVLSTEMPCIQHAAENNFINSITPFNAN